MAINYTPEQKQAIETLDKSVLVSAAAGSGKTAILVERILRIILEGRANVDELLVVTFTNAAASEMKLRLAAAIRKRMREEPEDAPRLREQLSRLYRAYITTIDSFALRVIREFFYETDLDPDFRACDEVQSEMMKREAAEELIEAGFENDRFLDIGDDDDASDGVRQAVNSVGFREFMRLYSEEREDSTFRDRMLKAYSGLRSVPDYFEWSYNKAEQLKTTPENFDGSDLQKAMLRDAEDTFEKAYDAAMRVSELFDSAGLRDMYTDKLADEVAVIEDVLADVRKGKLDRDVLDRAANISYARLSARKDQKEAFNSIKSEVTPLRDAYKKVINGWNLKYMTPDLETMLSEMNETYRYTVYYIRLLEEFERRYMEKKRERNVMDFSDMEHTAVRILRRKEPSEALRRRFKFIFIDEYQDTNRIQEELISRVSGPDNVFKVGDIKQSIYRFRQAEPDIFREVYEDFSDQSNQDGIAIDLGRNFRSNDATIRYINRVFSEVMEGYDERARLYTGVNCPPEYDFIPEVHLLTNEGMPEDDDDMGAGADGSYDASDDVDEDIVALSKEEAEAEYIAGIAESLIGTEFYDAKEGRVRNAEAKDIVILFRTVKSRGDIMSASLRKHGIDPHVEDSDDYFDTVEIGVAMSLLSCIDNMKRDVPLIATLHSEVFGWTPAQLAEVRIRHTEHMRDIREAEKNSGTYRRPAYWEALQWYREEGPEGELRDKAQYVYDRITEWRRLSRMMPLEDFVWYVLVDSGYYRMAGAMHGGARRQANLRTLADRAAGFSGETIASLSSYIDFVDVLKSRRISSGQTPAAAGDEVVRISTIHKSKGLEYPFVIVGGLGHRFRKDGNEKGFSFDSSIGVGMPYIDPSRKYWRTTLMQRAVNAKTERDSYSEELRVLYVALTRARNKLILVGTYRSEEELAKYTVMPDCYLKVMRNVLKTGLNTYTVRPLEMSNDAGKRPALNIPDELLKKAETRVSEAEARATAAEKRATEAEARLAEAEAKKPEAVTLAPEAEKIDIRVDLLTTKERDEYFEERSQWAADDRAKAEARKEYLRSLAEKTADRA